jgi:hypothetical protein
MAPETPKKSKAQWRDELIDACKCVQKDKRQPQAQCQPCDVQRRLDLEEEKQIYSDVREFRLTNRQWLEIVTKIHEEWYYTPEQRNELVSIFLNYDPNNNGQSPLENLKWIIMCAGEGEDPDEERRIDKDGNFEGYVVRCSGEAIGSMLLEQAPHLILGKNSSNKSQTMLRLAVTLNLDWPIRVIYNFYREKCLRNKLHHEKFMNDLSQALQQEFGNNSVLDTAVTQGRLQVVENLVKLLLVCKIDQSNRAGPLHTAITSGFDDIARCLVNSFPKMIEELVNNRSVLQTLELSSKLKNKSALEDFLVKKIYRVERTVLVKRLLHGPLGM